jgi:hypothetical protein
MALAGSTRLPQTDLEQLVETADAACIKCGFCLPTDPDIKR